MGIEMPKDKEYKDPNQLDIDFSGEITEGEFAQVFKELKEIDPNLDRNHLVEKNGEWKVIYKNIILSIAEWKQQKKLEPGDEREPNDYLRGNY